MRRPRIDRDTVMETITDPQLEPHYFLAGLLTLTALVATLLFLFFPNF